ncbi:stomatin-like protein 2, mitochondrial [Anopheles funestus]|uniref:Band 7 domain-containing protein n=1 Tax=Anopheles funestus TaxID=62324 RepID=A0A182RG98_ANOFN|nr:stomatin-like protein 2, mitochondrial [Anopheles funestus]
MIRSSAFISRLPLRGIAAATLNSNGALLQSPPSLAALQTTQVRYRSTPINTVIMFVPQQEAWIVERMGKFHRILEPGLNVLLPVVDRVKYVQSLKEIAIDVPKQSAITSDNVTLSIDGVLYLRILDPYLASYGVEDPEFAITQLAQTTMRSELGKMSLDKVFRERESLNISIVESINKASEAWGISCLRYEIRDIKLPSRVHEAMQMQVEAERRKRAAILESEGVRAADINVAEGKRQSRILASEAQKQEEINRANGEAAAIMALADARAKSLKIVAQSLSNEHGRSAASLSVAEKYVVAFEKLAKQNNTLIVPSTASDVTSMVAQALQIYNNLSNTSAISRVSSSSAGGDQQRRNADDVLGTLSETSSKLDATLTPLDSHHQGDSMGGSSSK